MHIIRHLDAFPTEARGGAVAIGNFDGVHRGHVAIVERLLERAEAVGGPAIVFTFDPHPVRLLRPEKSLTWTERKAELLKNQGVDWIVAYPTDEALLRLSAAEFFQGIVCNKLAARALVEGANFFFGHNREGTIERLAELTRGAGISLDVVQPVTIDGAIVSSSRVRELVRAGNVEQALTRSIRYFRRRECMPGGRIRASRTTRRRSTWGQVRRLATRQFAWKPT
jgi:riboflavin kinase/FMN adenylyltransferase